MKTSRLEAFSDGVMAVIITIMVLELKVPHGTDWIALRGLAPIFTAYVISFVYVAIYWNNHHHLLHLTERINGGVLWANMHLLFWLSLIPFTTGWMSENDFAPLPTALYGGVFLMSAVAWHILQRALVREQHNEKLRAALGADLKGKASLIIYLAAIPLAFVRPWLAIALYALVACLWLIPDRRFEAQLARDE
ncbi:MAG: DUF1211 domain-containing protein [Planctomycetes bacterium]|nr:DUF1211 domain-containing protein [Planctomycetota bacterium]